jgi:PAS domain S-box-containing protein
MRRNGERFYASRVVHPIRGAHGSMQGYLTIARDITSQMEARERLVREKAFSEAIISSLPGLFLVLDEQKRLRRWNRAVELITGRSEPELQGLEITNLVIEDDRNRLAAAIQETYQNGGASVEITLSGSHGEATPYLFTISRAHLNDNLCVIGIGLDISERKAVERSLQEAQGQLKEYAASLEQRVSDRTAELNQSLSSLEGVLYHVAHDLRAPLRAMGSFTSILLEEYAQSFDERGRGYARRITDAVQRMDELLLDLLAYGRLAHMDLPIVRLNLEEQVRLVIGRMSDRIHRRGSLIEVVPPFGQVCANQPVLLDVLGHLLSNALKFVPSDTPPQIRIWADDGPMIRLWVEDNGIGIRPEYHDRVFRIFERLHGERAYSGTGIGLAIVQKGIERMHGRVGLESEVGKGSRFWIELPRA